MSPSLLDMRFVLLLGSLGFLRVLWPRRFYTALVAVSSAVVVGLASPVTLLVIAGLTLLYLYPLHRLMRKAEAKGRTRLYRPLLWIGMGGLVAVFFLFKLERHFTIPGVGGGWIKSELLALVGFSYFLFRAIGFLNIQSIIKIDERRPWLMLCYTLFPPTITSGPIQKFQDFQKQMQAPEPLSLPLVGTAVYRITRGYFRKVVLAFVLNEAVTKLLVPMELTIVTSILVVTLLYLYFYFDFAGYSDIAIGFGLLMGIRVPENFRRPFHATTVSEFWRNWHITLVDWFRDHVFIPLGGMQSSRSKASALAFLTMILSGLWHGFSLSFLIWGIWHGLVLFTEGMLGLKPIPPNRRSGPRYWSRVLITNASVAAGGLLFLPDVANGLKVLRGFSHW